MAKKFNLKSRIISGLRKLWLWSPERKEALNAARVGRGNYLCSSCRRIYGPKLVMVDHRLPVVDAYVGFVSWDDYINRMFCGVENLQVLCKECHDKKTLEERELRNVLGQRRRNGAEPAV